MINWMAGGAKAISPILPITKSQNHQLRLVADKPALESLRAFLPEKLSKQTNYSSTGVLVAICRNNDQKLVDQGQYELSHIMAIDDSSGSMDLTSDLPDDSYLFWAVRDPVHAHEVVQKQLGDVSKKIEGKPVFALLFNNVGRGAGFFGREDLDFEELRSHYPDVPFIGVLQQWRDCQRQRGHYIRIPLFE